MSNQSTINSTVKYGKNFIQATCFFSGVIKLLKTKDTSDSFGIDLFSFLFFEFFSNSVSLRKISSAVAGRFN